MKVIDVLKKLGVWENVCIRPSVIHPHDMEALFGVAEEILKEHSLHLALTGFKKTCLPYYYW